MFFFGLVEKEKEKRGGIAVAIPKLI